MAVDRAPRQCHLPELIAPENNVAPARKLDRAQPAQPLAEDSINAKRLTQETTMLELRPTCEHCNTLLPPASMAARICSFECTFCAECVEQVLANVCPNCGGGFVPRPVRPLGLWKGKSPLVAAPASVTVRHVPVDAAAHAARSAHVKRVPPEQR